MYKPYHGFFKSKDMKLPKITRLPSGNYHAVIMIDGRRISITDDSADRVKARLLALKTDLIRETYHPDRILLRDACREYIDDRRGRLSPTTIDGYERIVNNSFESIMKKRVCDIDRKTLQKAVDDECKKISYRGMKMTPKTVTNRYTFIASVLKEYDIVHRIVLPDKKFQPVFVLTPEEIFKAVQGTPVELPVLLSMWLSFTMSEIKGLTKSKSIHGDKISIVETVVLVNGTEIRKPGGKEEKRSRTLTIPPYIKNLIDQVDGDIIVPASAASITNRFYRLLEKSGLPHIAYHKLRHINASVMAMLKIQPEIADERGGWKTSFVRERVYTHVFTPERAAADMKIDEYFSRIANGITNELQTDI